MRDFKGGMIGQVRLDFLYFRPPRIFSSLSMPYAPIAAFYDPPWFDLSIYHDPRKAELEEHKEEITFSRQ